MIESELTEPIVEVIEHLEAPALHAGEHFHYASLDRYRAIGKGCRLRQHSQSLPSELLGEWNSRGFKRAALTIPWPSEVQITPTAQRGGVLNDARLFQPMAFRDVDNIGIAVVHDLDGRCRVIPAKI